LRFITLTGLKQVIGSLFEGPTNEELSGLQRLRLEFSRGEWFRVTGDLDSSLLAYDKAITADGGDPQLVSQAYSCKAG
jgi:hypothetical protein